MARVAPTNGVGATSTTDTDHNLLGSDRHYGGQSAGLNHYGGQSAGLNHRIFLRPLAPPAVIGLTGFSISTFIVGSYLARWWGSVPGSPSLFYPLVLVSGGLGQFISAFYGLWARDVLSSVFHFTWGSFYFGFGIFYLVNALTAGPGQSLFAHFPEFGAWFVIIALFTWSTAMVAFRRDLILAVSFSSLALGTTIACSVFGYNNVHIRAAQKATGYFWLIAAFGTWWRVTVYLVEEAFEGSGFTRIFQTGHTRHEKSHPSYDDAHGEPGVVAGSQSVIRSSGDRGRTTKIAP